MKCPKCKGTGYIEEKERWAKLFIEDLPKDEIMSSETGLAIKFISTLITLNKMERKEE